MVYKTAFGELPYKDVQFIEFGFSGVIDQEQVAFLQYRLLMAEEVIQAHLEFGKKTGRMVMLTLVNPETVLKRVGIHYSIISRETIPYEEVVKLNNQFK